jgi:putative salt-induced outer membrane protein YdiY
MKMKIKYLAALVVLASSYSAVAEEEKEKTWEANSELGAIITSGNTDTTTFKFGAFYKHDISKWTNIYELSALYKADEVTLESGEKETQRTNERYKAKIQGNYNLNTENSHLFVSLTHDSDYFGAYRHETVLSVGYGLRLIDQTDLTMGLDFGPGYKYFQYSEENTESFSDGRLKAGEIDDEPILLTQADIKWVISDNAELVQMFKVEAGKTNTKSISDTAILTKINGSLQMKFGFNVTYNTKVDAGKVNTDTETVLTLVYSF